MSDRTEAVDTLSPWWRHAVVLVMVFGFTILIWRSVATYSDAPPIPTNVVDSSGETVFTGGDILAGQQVFLKYGLMENGSIWGHGAYLGPDFSAEYLHRLAMETAEAIGLERYGKVYASLDASERGAVEGQIRESLRANRYNPQTGSLGFDPSEVASF
jgi:nitric oxide reductase subunit B